MTKRSTLGQALPCRWGHGSKHGAEVLVCDVCILVGKDRQPTGERFLIMTRALKEVNTLGRKWLWGWSGQQSVGRMLWLRPEGGKGARKKDCDRPSPGVPGGSQVGGRCMMGSPQQGGCGSSPQVPIWYLEFLAFFPFFFLMNLFIWK